MAETNPSGVSETNEPAGLMGFEGIADQALRDEGEVAEDEPQDGAEEEGAEETADDEEGEADDQEDVATDEDEAESEDEEPEAETFTVKINGKEEAVTLDELKAGYQRNKDYTLSKQELAEQRRKIETEQQAIQQERQRYAEALQQASQSIQGELKKFENVDWERLKTEDPMEYQSMKLEFQDLREKQRENREAQQREYQKWQEQTTKQLSETRQKEQEALLTKRPDLKEPQKFQSFMTDLYNYGVNEGYDHEELVHLMDHRLVMTLDKARRYDAMKKANPGKKKVKNAPKMRKSKSSPSKGDHTRSRLGDSMKTLRKTGRPDDAAKVFYDMEDL